MNLVLAVLGYSSEGPKNLKAMLEGRFMFGSCSMFRVGLENLNLRSPRWFVGDACSFKFPVQFMWMLMEKRMGLN